VDEAQEVVERAIGGENVTTTVQGRERYPVNVRYMRGLQGQPWRAGPVLVSASGGQRQIPLRNWRPSRRQAGPSMIRNEDGLLTGYVYVDVAAATRAAISTRPVDCSEKDKTSSGICDLMERSI